MEGAIAIEINVRQFVVIHFPRFNRRIEPLVIMLLRTGTRARNQLPADFCIIGIFPGAAIDFESEVFGFAGCGPAQENALLRDRGCERYQLDRHDEIEIQVQNHAVMIRAAQGGAGVGFVAHRSVGVAQGVLDAGHCGSQRLRSQDVIQNLGIAAVHKRVAIRRGQVENLIGEIRVDFVGAGNHRLGGIRRRTFDLAQHIRIAIGEFESVEVTEYHQVDIRIGILEILHHFRNRTRLGLALQPHPVAIRRIVDLVHGTNVHVHDHNRLAGREFPFQNQRRPVVQQAAIKAENFVFAELVHRIHRDRVAHQVAHIDAADVVAFEQVGGVDDAGIIGLNLGRQVLQGGNRANFLRGQNVRGQHHFPDKLRQLGQVILVGGRIGIVDQQSQHVQRADGAFAGLFGANRLGQSGRAGDAQRRGPDLVIAKRIAQAAGSRKRRAGKEIDIGQPHAIRIDLEHFRIAIPDRQAADTRILDARFAEGAAGLGNDFRITEFIGGAGCRAAGDGDEHAFEALVLGGRLRLVWRGRDGIELHRRR